MTSTSIAEQAARGGRTFGFSEVAGAGGCAIGAAAGMAVSEIVSEYRAGLRL